MRRVHKNLYISDRPLIKVTLMYINYVCDILKRFHEAFQKRLQHRNLKLMIELNEVFKIFCPFLLHMFCYGRIGYKADGMLCLI